MPTTAHFGAHTKSHPPNRCALLRNVKHRQGLTTPSKIKRNDNIGTVALISISSTSATDNGFSQNGLQLLGDLSVEALHALLHARGAPQLLAEQ